MSKPFKRDFGSREIPHWITAPGGEEFVDIKYQTGDGIAKITINRPQVRNAFRPQTIIELIEAFNLARDNEEVGVIIFTGEGTEAFCSGGDINVRGDDGYLGDDKLAKKGIGRLNVLDLQVQIRRTPKPVVAMIAGWAGRHRSTSHYGWLLSLSLVSAVYSGSAFSQAPLFLGYSATTETSLLFITFLLSLL